MSLGKRNISLNISSKAQIPNKISTDFLNKFIDLIKNNSRTRVLKIANFGSFHTRNTPERIGRNPKTNEEFIIFKKSKLFFKTSNNIKNLLN